MGQVLEFKRPATQRDENSISWPQVVVMGCLAAYVYFLIWYIFE